MLTASSVASIAARVPGDDAATARGRRDRPGLDALARRRRSSSLRAFDRRFGGFGGAPKFPRPSELLFLLRELARTGRRRRARHGAAARSARWRTGGMRDHLGGGFHRYSVDGAGACRTSRRCSTTRRSSCSRYLEASQVTGDPLLAAVADDTLPTSMRDMTDAGGGFYSAEDADSVPPEAGRERRRAHKAEGAFYIWPRRRVETLLGDAARASCALRFGIEADGNAPFDPQQEFTGKNLLYTARDRSRTSPRASAGRSTTSSTCSRARGRRCSRRAAAGRVRISTTRC